MHSNSGIPCSWHILRVRASNGNVVKTNDMILNYSITHTTRMFQCTHYAANLMNFFNNAIRLLLFVVDTTSVTTQYWISLNRLIKMSRFEVIWMGKEEKKNKWKSWNVSIVSSFQAFKWVGNKRRRKLFHFRMKRNKALKSIFSESVTHFPNFYYGERANKRVEWKSFIFSFCPMHLEETSH